MNRRINMSVFPWLFCYVLNPTINSAGLVEPPETLTFARMKGPASNSYVKYDATDCTGTIAFI